MQPPADRQPLGRHLLLECWGCSDAINSTEQMERAIEETVVRVGATLLHLHSHQFSPQGVTAFGLLAESHLSLHSWPERQYLAADLFTCGEPVDPEQVATVLRSRFGPSQIDILELDRGAEPGTGPAVRESPGVLSALRREV